MRLRKTNKVDSHHTNPDYVCLIVEWLIADNNIRTRKFGEVLVDWMPTDEEIIRLIDAMLEISPSFKRKFLAKFGNKGKDKKQSSLGDF